MNCLLTFSLWPLFAGGRATWQISGLLWHSSGEGRDIGSPKCHPPEDSLSPPLSWPQTHTTPSPPLCPPSNLEPVRLDTLFNQLHSLSQHITLWQAFKKYILHLVNEVHPASTDCLWCVLSVAVVSDVFFLYIYFYEIITSEYLHSIVIIAFSRSIFIMVMFQYHVWGAHRWMKQFGFSSFFWSYPSMPVTSVTLLLRLGSKMSF